MDGMRGGNENCYEIYYIKEDGLKLLLAGLGQKTWYGLFSKDAALEAEISAVNRTLAGLYQDGVIDWEDGGAAVRKPYAEMLSAMLETKKCVTVQAPGAASALRCCYLCAAGVVMTHKSQREADTLGLSQISLQSFAGLLSEACARLEEGECCTLSWHSSENGQVYQSVRILRDGLRRFRMEKDAGRGGRFSCACGEFQNKIQELFFKEDAGNDIG